MPHTPYSEILVNTYTTGEQMEPEVAALAGGGWVVTWGDTDRNGGSYEIYQQAYNADGSMLGGETQVNTYVTGNHFIGSLIGLAGGGWVVGWGDNTGHDGDGSGIYQHAYHADGTPMGDEAAVNSYTTGNQSNASAIALAGGGWVTTWMSNGEDGDGLGIYQQVYRASGKAKGGEVHVSTATSGFQSGSHAAALAGGGWVVSWSSQGQDGDGYGVYQQAYHADGTTAHGEVRVNTTTAGDEFANGVTGLTGGGWVVTWADGFGASNIYQQAYAADGTVVGDETRVNASTDGYHFFKAATALENGGWVVTWADGSGVSNSYQQAYAADGSPLGGETQINTYTSGSSYIDSTVALADGGWVEVWEADGQDGDGWGIYQRIYNADGTARTGDMQVNTTTTADQGEANATGLADGGWVVTWYSGSQAAHNYDVYQRRYDADGTIHGTNHAPTAAGSTVKELTNGLYAFSKNTFGFSDGTDGDHLASVVITALPLAGKLLLDGEAVTMGETIAAADLAHLVWQAGKHALSATIKFKVIDNGGTEAGGKDTSAAHTLTFAIKSDTFTGTKAADTLVGTDGHDIFNGNAGNDRLTGGAANDTFVFKTGDGQDRITDFHHDQGDKIDLSGADGIASYRDLVKNHLSGGDHAVVISVGDDDTIRLLHVSAGDLHRGDFVF